MNYYQFIMQRAFEIGNSVAVTIEEHVSKTSGAIDLDIDAKELNRMIKKLRENRYQAYRKF